MTKDYSPTRTLAGVIRELNSLETVRAQVEITLVAEPGPESTLGRYTIGFASSPTTPHARWQARDVSSCSKQLANCAESRRQRLMSCSGRLKRHVRRRGGS